MKGWSFNIIPCHLPLPLASMSVQESKRAGIFPRVMDCFPSMTAFPGCTVPSVPQYPNTSNYCNVSETSPRRVRSPSDEYIPCIQIPPIPTDTTVGDEEEILFPTGGDSKQSDLPTIPPPHEYWKLKKIDPTANVMDYWIKSSQEWDIDGIESDIAVCLKQ